MYDHRLNPRQNGRPQKKTKKPQYLVNAFGLMLQMQAASHVVFVVREINVPILVKKKTPDT